MNFFTRRMFNVLSEYLNKNKMRYLLVFITIVFVSCTSKQKITKEELVVELSQASGNQVYELEFIKGESFYYPSFAIWVEDLEGNYLETLYVTRYVGKGVFGHGALIEGKWSTTPGLARRPAALPYWSHKRGIKAPDGLFIPSPETAVADALTSATPQNDFVIRSKISLPQNRFRILFEINQPWDSNRYWNNSKFKGDKEYYTSLQPALVYETVVDIDSQKEEFDFTLIGHSHPSGKDGELYSDMSTFTTALNIVQKISLRLK